MDKEFQCCQCQQEFNLQERTPLVLPSCGHSICQLCVNQYLQSQTELICKEDSIQCQVEREIKSFPINQSIIALLRKKRTNQKSHTYITPEDSIPRISAEDVSEFQGENQQHLFLQKHISQSHSCDILPPQELKDNMCPIHYKQLELVCQQDGQYICVNCALFGPHKLHNYKPIDQYIKEMEHTVNEITNVYEQIKEYSNQIQGNNHIIQFNNKLQQSKDIQLQQIDNKFNILFEELNIIKQEMKNKIIANYNQSYDEQKTKLEQEFVEIKKEADDWLQYAGGQLNEFLDKSQNQKQITMDNTLLENGNTINSKITLKFKSIDNQIQYIQDTQDIFIPIENIKQQFTNDDQKQIDQLLLDKDVKLLESDIIYQDLSQKFSQSIQSSEQPTQPQSPQYNVGKINYFSQTFTPGMNRKDRSATILQTEPSEAQTPNTNRNKLSTSKFAKIQKYCTNPKMNEKVLNSLSLLEKFEMVDFSQIDFNDSILHAIEEILKMKKVVKVLKMSKCKITDELFAKLIQIIDESSVTALHLQSNLLTDKSLDILLGNMKTKQYIECKQIYMNSNTIQAVKCKKKIEEIKKYGIQIMI